MSLLMRSARLFELHRRGQRKHSERQGQLCTENFIRVDDMTESPKLAE